LEAELAGRKNAKMKTLTKIGQNIGPITSNNFKNMNTVRFPSFPDQTVIICEIMSKKTPMENVAPMQNITSLNSNKALENLMTLKI
jgi:hypothetical protein